MYIPDRDQERFKSQTDHDFRGSAVQRVGGESANKDLPSSNGIAEQA